MPDPLKGQQKEKPTMRKALIASIPAFAVLFVLVFGFVTFHVPVQNAEADACTYLTAQCRTESENVTISCYVPPINQERCNYAREDYEKVCNAAAKACND